MNRLVIHIGRVALTLVLVAAALVALLFVWRYYEDQPWTRDGKLRADVVQVSADVSGLVTQVLVHDNQMVRAGQTLFVVDQERYQAAYAQADAAVANARAALDDAVREQRRYLALGDLVSQEVRDQRVTTAEQDQAQLKQTLANLRVAQINLIRSNVKARVNGYVTGFTMRPGDYVTSGGALFALVDTDSFYVLGYFEENKLHAFHLGDRARVTLLGDKRELAGHVDSMSAGIADREDTGSTSLLPNITPTFSWIRLAQRVPVRVVIDGVPADVRLVAGRTASVTILPTVARVTPSAAPDTSVRTNTAPLHRPVTPAAPPSPAQSQSAVVRP
ncbi:MAG: efflux RND transporter periplasmic adaptor subunit [Caulobacteraceae bacterium]